jgi:DNA-binding response OmpR family regulator
MTKATPNRALADLRILVVEDEVVVGILLEELLEDAGARVKLAHNIDGALGAIQQEAFDGVLLDINLHGITTEPVAEDLRRRAVPFIVVTGYDSTENDPPALKAASRLQKPFSRVELLRRMTEVFAGDTVA